MQTIYQDIFKYDFPTFIGKTLSIVDPGATYLPNWHIDFIAEYLEAARRGEITRLIINLPPRSLKSVCVSVAWPAWLLGHAPHSRVMAASYSASLSVKHSLDCRSVIQSEWYKRLFPDVKLTRDQNEKHKFMTTQRGYRFATSVGGSTTGEGGNFLIIDDPISPANAMNNHCRDYANHWFDHTFASRLDDKRKGVMVLVMQRLHQHDMTGYLLAKGGWEHVSLPAIAPEAKQYCFGDICKGTRVGEPLHEARENEALINRAKIELGSSAFAAQYQQQPLPEEGAMLRPWWFGRYKEIPESITRVVQSWDTAIKSGSSHDASVCLTFAESEGKSYLVDVKSVRLEYPDLKKLLYKHAADWEPDAVLIEDKASGQQLLQDARRETMLPLVPIKPKGDKITRFAATSAMIEAGRVVLPQQACWLADFETEIFSFPAGGYDDQVDSLTQYLNWLREGIWEKLRIRRL